jgi:Pyrimidine dimer DNA glycosylase
MRLWSLHPRYLDRQGLIALWREALLAKAVLSGKTKGYTHHPQLERFRAHPSPVSAINAYLDAIHAEASRRGYAFDRRKIGPVREVEPIPVTGGQIAHEWQHLMKKLASRNPQAYRQWLNTRRAACHPLFRRVHGAIEIWERS